MNGPRLLLALLCAACASGSTAAAPQPKRAPATTATCDAPTRGRSGTSDARERERSLGDDRAEIDAELEATSPIERPVPCLAEARAHATTLAREPDGDDSIPLVEPGASFAVSRVPDLDGDGVCDLDLTPSTGRWGKVWPHLLYLSGECSFAGGLLDADLRVRSEEVNGRPVIEATSATGCAGWDFVWTRYEWTGARYEEAREVSCCVPEECCSGDDQACADYCARNDTRFCRETLRQDAAGPDACDP